MALSKKFLTTVIFFSEIFTLVIYLMAIKYAIYIPMYLFWISIIIIFCDILFQILRIKLTDNFVKIILFEIGILSLVFHLIYQIPYYGLYGSDAYFDLNSMKGILLSGHLTPTFTNITTFWPILHIMGSTLSLISNLNTLYVAKWFPSLYGIIVPVVYYLTIQKLYNDKKVALVSSLLFVSLHHYILFGSLFTRESIALVFTIFCIYLYFISKSQKKYSLSILFLATITLSHHFTSLILALIFFVHYITSRILVTTRSVSKNIAGKWLTTNTILLVFVVPFAYWIYIIMTPLITIVTFFVELTNFNSPTFAELYSINSTSLESMRSYILYYGFFIFHGIFGIFLMCQLLSQNDKKILETYSFTIFLFFLGFIGLLFLYVIPLNNAALFPDRFLAYGWMLGFGPLSLFIIKSNYISVRKIGLVLLFTFMLYNIYSIDGSAWNPRHNVIQSSTSYEEYNLAKVLNFQSDTYLMAYPSTLMAIYDVQGYLGNYDIMYTSEVELDYIDWIVINKKLLELKKKEFEKENINYDLNKLNVNNNFLKVYDSNNLTGFYTRRQI